MLQSFVLPFYFFVCFCLNVNKLCVRDVFLRTQSNTDTGLTNTDTIAVADPHLQISGRGGEGGHPDPEIRGRRPCGGGFHCTNFTHSSYVLFNFLRR